MLKLASVTGLALSGLALVGCSASTGENTGTTQADIGARKTTAYTVQDLGTLGGPTGFAFGLNQLGQVGGNSALPGGNQHAFLWSRGKLTDLGALGGAGANSAGNAPNFYGQVPVFSDTSQPDPLGENFCGFFSGLSCLGAVAKGGKLVALPTLGGTNGEALASNDWGTVVGLAENATHDPSCPAPQVLDFEAVQWTPSGEIQALAPLAGDTVGFALSINDVGQIVGGSGTCANSPLFPLQIAPHAVLWDHGVPRNLGSLSPEAQFSTATSVNNFGAVLGGSQVASGAFHSFLWSEGRGIRDLGTVAGDLGSLPGGMGAINDLGQAVGMSCVNDPSCNQANPNLQTRAYLWSDNVMTDLNSLIQPNSGLYLIVGFGINDAGQIAGIAIDQSLGVPHAFLATPNRR